MSKIIKQNLSEVQLAQLGFSIGSNLFGGAFIALFGDLGAGKTTLTRSIAKALKIDDISSPTFLIVEEHEGLLPLFHFDAYRLSGEQELYDIGFDDYINRNGVIIMEWCENVAGVLPEERIEIKIEGSGFSPRNLTIEAFGEKHSKLLENIK